MRTGARPSLPATRASTSSTWSTLRSSPFCEIPNASFVPSGEGTDQSRAARSPKVVGSSSRCSRSPIRTYVRGCCASPSRRSKNTRAPPTDTRPMEPISKSVASRSRSAGSGESALADRCCWPSIHARVTSESVSSTR